MFLPMTHRQSDKSFSVYVRIIAGGYPATDLFRLIFCRMYSKDVLSEFVDLVLNGRYIFRYDT